MGVSYHPTTTTRGLINCLDTVGNNPIIGTTFIDRSMSRNNGTLSGGNQVINSGIPFIRFSGVDGAMQISPPSLTNQMSLEVVIRPLGFNTTNSVAWILGRESNYRLTYSQSSFQFICATSNNAWFSTGTNIQATASTSGNLFHIIGTYNGSQLFLYVNGVQQASGALISGNTLGISNYYIAQSDAGNVSYGRFDMFVHKVYNVGLTPSEVSRNFNAIKGRFGL